MLTSMTPEIENLLSAAVKPGPSRIAAGIAVAASNRDGTKSFRRGFGTLALDSRQPVDVDDSVFWIASCTMLITSIAALQCVERGLFSLDSTDDVARLLPEMACPDVVRLREDDTLETRKAKRTFTLREALSHSSGLAYDLFDPALLAWREQRGERPKWMVRDTKKAHCIPLSFDPGTSWRHSSGLDWAGVMIERATGQRLGDYLFAHVFRPLGMDSTSFDSDLMPELSERLVQPVTCEDRACGPIVPGAPDWCTMVPGPDNAGGNGLYGTATDFIKVLESLLRMDGKLLRPETARMMMTPQLSGGALREQQKSMAHPDVLEIFHPGWGPARDGTEWSYSLCGDVLQRDLPGRARRGMVTWSGISNCVWWIDIESEYCGVLFTHVYPFGESGVRDLWKRVYEEMYGMFGGGKRMNGRV